MIQVIPLVHYGSKGKIILNMRVECLRVDLVEHNILNVSVAKDNVRLLSIFKK